MLVGYARISSTDQKFELQNDALKAAGCARIFHDTASGALRDRPMLTAALDFMREGDTLVVWKLDRLARSVKQLIETIEYVNKKGVGFRSLTESIDTTTPGGRLIFHMFGALAEFERGIIRERTIAGLESARARGRRGGRPRALNEQGVSVAKALLRDGSLTVREVANQLNVSEATLYKYIPSPRASTN
jgi:DNA invertase Pin-like site-specific DNA recombinase